MIRVVHPGSGSGFFTHPRSRIQGVKKAPDPGFEPATLLLYLVSLAVVAGGFPNIAFPTFLLLLELLLVLLTSLRFRRLFSSICIQCCWPPCFTGCGLLAAVYFPAVACVRMACGVHTFVNVAGVPAVAASLLILASAFQLVSLRTVKCFTVFYWIAIGLMILF